MFARKLAIERIGPILTEFGVVVYLASIPLSQGLGTSFRNLLLLSIMTGMVLTRVSEYRGKGTLRPFRLVFPIVVFGATLLLSYVFSELPELSRSLGLYVPIAFLFFFAIQDSVRDLPSFRRLCITLSIVVSLIGVDAVYQWMSGTSLFGGRPLYLGRVAGSLPHPNDLALVPILLPLALCTLVVSRKLIIRVVSGVCIPLGLAAVILSQSRNAWLGVAIALAMAFTLGVRRRLILVSGIVCTILIFVALVFDVANFRGRLVTTRHLGKEGRIGIYLVAWEMFKDAPMVGHGNFTFGEFYLPYLKKVDLPQGYRPEAKFIPWAHNLYLEALAERGAIGLAGFLVPVIAMTLWLKRLLQAQLQYELRTATIGCAIGFGVFLGMGLFDLTFLKDWVLLVFLVLAGLVARLSDLGGLAYHAATAPRPRPIESGS